jgi:hypothetical protein
MIKGGHILKGMTKAAREVSAIGERFSLRTFCSLILKLEIHFFESGKQIGAEHQMVRIFLSKCLKFMLMHFLSEQ